MKFENISRSFTIVHTKDGLTRVEGGETVDVTGDRRVELANENPRLRAVAEKKSSSKSSTSSKSSSKTSAKRSSKKSSSKSTGTVTSDKVARKR